MSKVYSLEIVEGDNLSTIYGNYKNLLTKERLHGPGASAYIAFSINHEAWQFRDMQPVDDDGRFKYQIQATDFVGSGTIRMQATFVDNTGRIATTPEDVFISLVLKQKRTA